MRYIKPRSLACEREQTQKLSDFINDLPHKVTSEYIEMVSHLACLTFHEGRFNITLVMFMVFLMDDTCKQIDYHTHLLTICPEPSCYCHVARKINRYIIEKVMSKEEETSYQYFFDEYTYSLTMKLKQIRSKYRTHLCYLRNKRLTMGTTFVFIVMVKDHTCVNTLFNLSSVDRLLEMAETDIMLVNDKYSYVKEGIEGEVSILLWNNSVKVELDHLIDVNYKLFNRCLDKFKANDRKALQGLKHLIDANWLWS